MELRQNARAPDAGFGIGSDRLGETELRREQQLFDITDEGVVPEILHCDDRRRLLQIGQRAVDIHPVIGEAPGDDAHVLRPRQADSDIRFSLQQAELPCGDCPNSDSTSCSPSPAAH
jgi:hypothetical protein